MAKFDAEFERRNQELLAIAQTGTKDEKIAARNEIVVRNMGLVRDLANYRCRKDSRFSVDDAINEGVFGLFRAIDKFDRTLDPLPRFSTYAVWWVDSKIRAYTGRSKTQIRVSLKNQRLVHELGRVEEDLMKELGRMPTLDEIMDRTGWSRTKFEEVCRQALVTGGTLQCIRFARRQSTPSMERFVKRGRALENADRDPCTFDDEETRLLLLVDTLRPRLRDVVKARCGMPPFKRAETLQEIGVRLGVSKERVRQIEADAHRRLERRAKRMTDDRIALAEHRSRKVLSQVVSSVIRTL